MAKMKFKIMYPADYHDQGKAGKQYKPDAGQMVLMKGGGVFFLYDGQPYYPSIKKLSDVLPKYDVVWR